MVKMKSFSIIFLKKHLLQSCPYSENESGANAGGIQNIPVMQGQPGHGFKTEEEQTKSG